MSEVARLAQSILKFVGSEERMGTAIPELSLHRRVAQTEPCAMTYEPNLTVLAQGSKRVELGSHVFVYDPARFLLTAVDLPVISRIVGASAQEPCLALSLKLDMAMVREVIGRQDGQVPEPAANQPAMATALVTDELRSACRRLIELLGQPEDRHFLSGLLQREIIYRVLRSEAGPRLRAVATLGDQSQRTARAIAWVRANFTKTLRMSELASVAGMGVSTLHHHFRELTSMSPLQYQKHLRLQGARARMLMDGLDAASAAFEVGYASASQFNREYSRRFGQPPRRDTRMNRRAVWPASLGGSPSN